MHFVAFNSLPLPTSFFVVVFFLTFRLAFQAFLKKQINKGLSILFVTHDVHYALDVSDKIIFASQENLLQFDSKQALLNCKTPIVHEFMTRPENQAIT